MGLENHLGGGDPEAHVNPLLPGRIPQVGGERGGGAGRLRGKREKRRERRKRREKRERRDRREKRG